MGVYELLKHDKLKKEIFNAHARQTDARSRANSLSSCVSQLPASVAYQGFQFYSVENADSWGPPPQSKKEKGFRDVARRSMDTPITPLNCSISSLP